MMTNRKDLVIAVLGTFCLTATLFMIVPTRSQSGLNDYDTWTDVNGDGTIDMADISISIDKFMTSGDTTRNVTITGHATKLIRPAYGVNLNLSSQSWSSGLIPVDGYSKVTISIYSFWVVGPPMLNYFLYSSDGDTNFRTDSISFDNAIVQTYDIPNQYISILVSNPSTNQVWIYVDVYLVA